MSKYANLTFHHAADLPKGRGEVVFREARLGKLFWLAFFVAVTAGVEISPWLFPSFLTSRGIPSFLPMVIGGFLLLFVWVAYHALGSSLRASNWLLRAAPSGLYIKYRSYLNHSLPAADETVVFIPKREIAWLRERRQDALIPSRDYAKADRRALRSALEIQLHGEDVGDLTARLEEERTRQAPGVMGTKAKALHYPVRTRPGGRVQIDWAGPETQIRPGLATALKRLGRDYQIKEPHASAQAPVENLTRAEQETRLLEFAERGDTISAVILAQRLYGFNTTEAQDFINNLRGA